MDKTEFSDAELLRYSRHLLLPAIDVAGQLAISNGRVLVMGVGGLGSPVVQYLAAAGVGHLVLVDDDVVDVSNLQRQVIHAQARVGLPKVESAKVAAQALNDQVTITTFAQRLDGEALREQVANADVVVDCTDNLASRHLLNRVCRTERKPLVSGAAIRLEGQLTVFDAREQANPCYQCLYGQIGEEQETCAQNGVLSPLVGVIGSAQAVEVLKILASAGETLVGRLQLYDALRGVWRELRYRQDPDCSVCGN